MQIEEFKSYHHWKLWLKDNYPQCKEIRSLTKGRTTFFAACVDGLIVSEFELISRI